VVFFDWAGTKTIEGIDHVYTTDSYSDHWVLMNQDGVTVLANYLRDWVTGPKGPPSIDDERRERDAKRSARKTEGA